MVPLVTNDSSSAPNSPYSNEKIDNDDQQQSPSQSPSQPNSTVPCPTTLCLQVFLNNIQHPHDIHNALQQISEKVNENKE